LAAREAEEYGPWELWTVNRHFDPATSVGGAEDGAEDLDRLAVLRALLEL